MNATHQAPPDAVPACSLAALLAGYHRASFAVVRIPHRDGQPSKAPSLAGWNLPRSAENPHGYTDDLAAAHGDLLVSKIVEDFVERY